MAYVKTYRNSKNLFDKSNVDIYNNSRVDTTDDKWKLYEGQGKTIRIPCQPSTQYAISIDENITTTIFRVLAVSTDDIPIENRDVSGITLITSSTNNRAIFTTRSSTKYIIFQVHDQVFSAAINTLMLCTGSVSYNYEEYNVTAWYDFCKKKTADGWTDGTTGKAPF